MDSKSTTLPLENGLDLGQLMTTGSILHINEDYEFDSPLESDNTNARTIDYIGEPVQSFCELAKQMTAVDDHGFVKKKILEEGGGLPLHEGCTVSIAFSGYWENDPEPFDVKKTDKPLVVDLKDTGLLPGLQTAIESMLVGELSMFLLSYQVMYGELGVPPRIKPKSDCVFYVKLMKSILTPKDGKLDLSEPNMFDRVHHEVKMLYSSGVTLNKTRNYTAAIQVFKKAISMLHRCRLANEEEENKQEKLLIKLYTNMAICCNKIKKPLQTCIACNELNRLNSLWNNGKVLYQNGKALRMIGQYDMAEKRIKRAMKLCANNEEIKSELEILQKTRDSCNQSKLRGEDIAGLSTDLISDHFKQEVDQLIKNFKDNVDLCKLTLPPGLNSAEIDYIKDTCIKENLFFNKIQKNYLLDKDDEKIPLGEKVEEIFVG